MGVVPNESTRSDEGEVTETISNWTVDLKWESIPQHVRDRAKTLILDGVSCAIIASHLPWSEDAVRAVLTTETPGGISPIIGWKDLKTGLIGSALINSAFIQGFELDDYHATAPLHNNSILMPAVLSAAASVGYEKVSGKDFILAMIAGYEVGPRVGNSLGGGNILSKGWHSGAVFGAPAAAAACSKIFELDATQMEDAFGMACTQACGLTSARFESSVKRMQHGFAARNGLFAAMMAKANYKGISKIFDRKLGGFVEVFSNGVEQGNRKEEIIKDLSKVWETLNIHIKPYPCMGGIHSTVDCVLELQKSEAIPVGLKAADIESVRIELTEPAFKHGGWKATKPLNEIGAQMNVTYICAIIIRDGVLTMKHFAKEKINEQSLWDIVDKTTCSIAEFSEYPTSADRANGLCARVTIKLANGEEKVSTIPQPKGVRAATTHEEVAEKFRQLTQGIITKEQQDNIQRVVEKLDKAETLNDLVDAMNLTARSPLDV
jgi:aconitate decarboxylase